jgi:hypothetical protein
MALVAQVVYRRLGLMLLRSAWINLDWMWAGVLVVTGCIVLVNRASYIVQNAPRIARPI